MTKTNFSPIGGTNLSIVADAGGDGIWIGSSTGDDTHVPASALAGSFGAVTRGLLLRWKLNEGSGNLAKDSSGKGIDGTIAGAPSWTSGRFLLNALVAINSTQYISSSDSSLPAGGLPRTLCAWFKTSSVDSNYHSIAGYGDRGTVTKFFGLMISDTGLLISGILGGGGDIASSTSVKDGVWHHAVTTWDGVTRRLFLDGAEIGTPNTTQFSTTLTGTFIAASDSASESLVGSISDVRIYNRAISAEEVAAIYAGIG